jgi:WD40 repeat protein
LAVLHGHSQDVKSVLWHPTQRVLFSCGYDDLVKIWAEEDLEWYCVNTLSLHKSTVWSMDFDATGKHFGRFVLFVFGLIT